MDLPATATEYLYFRKALDVMKGLDATMWVLVLELWSCSSSYEKDIFGFNVSETATQKHKV